MALKTLHRSAELRRQLSQARAAASSIEVGSTTPPPLDPSVKALIEKLTELAKIVPHAHSGDPPARSAQRAFHGGGNPNADSQQSAEVAGYPPRARVQNTTDGNTLLIATTAMGQAASRGLLPHEINEDGANPSGWEEREPTGSVLSATNDAEDDDDGFGGEEKDTTGGGLVGPPVPSSEDFMGATEEDDILTQQLRELDTNMNTVFEDLEKKGKKSKDSELSKKAGGTTAENLSKEEGEERKREEDARQKERAALLVQLEGLSGGGHTRRPLWRWIAEGVDDPHPDRVLKGKQLWKAAALLVIVFFVRPKRTLMQRKARYCCDVSPPISKPDSLVGFYFTPLLAVFHTSYMESTSTPMFLLPKFAWEGRHGTPPLPCFVIGLWYVHREFYD